MENTVEDEITTASSEKRRDQRTPVNAQVHMTIRDTQGSVISAVLLDFSRCGLRVRYEGAYLCPGTWIGICYPWGEVPAKVIWTATTGVKRETGLALSIAAQAGYTYSFGSGNERE